MRLSSLYECVISYLYGGGECNQYWSLVGPVLVSYSDQYYLAS